MLSVRKVVSVAAVLALASPLVNADECIDCHRNETRSIVVDWQISRHSGADVSCRDCHKGRHTSGDDVDRLQTVTAQTCAGCHEEKFEQFSRGKHALAWSAVEAMPTTHALPMASLQGMKGCDSCHKVGLKNAQEIAELKAEGSVFGHASCDACHTRHTFSVVEAQQPQACQTCHTGFDHPQWEMWSASKHGVRFLLAQNGTLPDETPAPTCQDCHMIDGTHEVRTAWGFLGVRLPLSEDEQWGADQATILRALGVLDADGNPTPRLDTFRQMDVARLTEEDFERERSQMIGVCEACHSANFARAELAKGDDLVREMDHLLAEAIREIASLYEDGIIPQPESYALPFPDLLSFHDAPTAIEQRLFEMHLKHRMRAFQGAFHSNPEYALWHGRSEMIRELQLIRQEAKELRRRAASPTGQATSAASGS